MRYDIEVNGRLRQVNVVRTSGDRFAVSVDGRTWHIDAARVDRYTLSLVVAAREPGGADGHGGASHEVVLVPGGGSGTLEVHVDGSRIAVAPNGRRRWGSRDAGLQAGDGPQQITAPMPGKIVRVLVQTGEAVCARQSLVVIEAMKMENELRAGRDGTVADIRVREGMSVDAGALLVLLR